MTGNPNQFGWNTIFIASVDVDCRNKIIFFLLVKKLGKTESEILSLGDYLQTI